MFPTHDRHRRGRDPEASAAPICRPGRLALLGVLAAFALHAPPADADDDEMARTFTYAGRVLGPDGKPLAGAKVWISGLKPGVIEYAERTPTGKDGTFRFTVRRDEFGTVAATPTEAHIRAANTLISSLRQDLLRLTKKVSTATDAATHGAPGVQQGRAVGGRPAPRRGTAE